MEIRYSREMNHNYMIIEAPEEETGYAVQMLSANAIEGLLKFRVRQTEEAREYYYEITSRQPLRRVLEKRTLSGQELRSILLSVLAVLKRVEEYLLKEEQLLLDPEYLYLEPDHFTVELCLVPGHREEAPQALSKLLGYLLERADHQDREAVVLAYNLYQISLRENYGTADLAAKHEKPADAPCAHPLVILREMKKGRPDVPVSSDVVSKVCKTGLTAASIV